MRSERLWLLLPGAVFLVYFANVVAGAAGLGVFLSDVGEMLTLFAACVSFVIVTLVFERSARIRDANSGSAESEGE